MSSWNTDAQFASTINKKFIFTNKKIDDFLDSYEKTIVVASKGMGKTLLLRLKKQLIEGAYEGILTIPQNETADYVTLPVSPTKGDLLKRVFNSVFLSLSSQTKQREPSTAKFYHKLGHCMHDFRVIFKLISVYFCQKAHYSCEVLYTVANEQARRRL